MTDTAINDVISYPNTVPAAGDHVIGTDVSDTSNDADGETVTFEMQAMATLFASLAGGWQYVEQLTSSGTTMTTSEFEDGFAYLLVGYDVAPNSGTTRKIYIDAQKDSDDSWIGGGSHANLANSLSSGEYAGFRLEVFDPRISRTNHQFFHQTTVHTAALSSKSDAFQDAVSGSTHNDEHEFALNFSSADKIKAVRIACDTTYKSGGVINVYKQPVAHS